MDITLFISRFLYRIRYQLIFGSIIVTALVAYFSGFLPKKYTISTTIYTGIASSNGLNDTDKPSYLELNNTFDNLIQLTKAKGTLEKVSLQLFALNMIHGNAQEDNLYILSKNYKDLEHNVPEYIKSLIDTTSLEKSIVNLKEYRKDIPGNYLFNLFNNTWGHYSINALNKIQVHRIANSDLIEISYESDDPGIALSTVKLVKEELIQSYKSLRYTAAADVIKYFEDELHILRKELTEQEDALTLYNIENQVINYGEQTKAIASAFTGYEDRYEQALREYESAQQIIKELEDRMDIRSKLTRTNREFIIVLDSLSAINGKITEIEMFHADTTNIESNELEVYKNKLKKTEDYISKLSDNMNDYKYSKEGVGIEEMVDIWVKEVIRSTKAKAELRILETRKAEFEEKYKVFSPVGAEINRKERDIAMKEKSYMEHLHGLNLSKMKMKNIQLTSASLNTVSAPTYPMNPGSSKRGILIIGAFIGSLIFIIGYNLIIELLDRTLRDSERTRRLTNTSVLGAFTGNHHLQYRGYVKECHRISARYACNKLNQHLSFGKPLFINLLSIEGGEGKSFIAGYLKATWEEQGLRVSYLKAGIDFAINQDYLRMEGPEELIEKREKADIIIIEHMNIQHNPLSSGIIKGGDVNLLIANACRVWRFSDDEHLKHLKAILKNKALYIYLNNAGREAVEDFTGQLPPRTSIRSLANQMTYMGITAGNAAVK